VLREQIINLARSTFVDKYEEKVSANFHWLRTDLQNGNRRKLADEIVALIGRTIPNDIYESIVIEPQGAGEIDRLITRISVRRERPSSKGVWSNWEVGPEGASVEEIQKLIDVKDSKIDAYQQKCELVWLVIVADGRYISSSAGIDSTIRHHRFETRFDKVLFYYTDSRAVHQLQRKASPQFNVHARTN